MPIQEPRRRPTSSLVAGAAALAVAWPALAPMPERGAPRVLAQVASPPSQESAESVGTGETAAAGARPERAAPGAPRKNSGDDPRKGERTRENERGSTDVNRPN